MKPESASIIDWSSKCLKSEMFFREKRGEKGWNVSRMKNINLTISSIDDIYMSLSPYMWKDSERLLEWVTTRASTKKGVTRSRLRKVLKALRMVIGQKGKVEMDTTVLSKKELYNLLDQELKKIIA